MGIPNSENNNSPSMGIKVDEWTPLVIAKLREKFGDRTEDLFTLLRDTGSLIAGGQILSACQPFDQKDDEPDSVRDTDIYVPVKNIPTFLNTFIKGENPIYQANTFKRYGATLYCKSFLRKNGIRTVFKFAYKQQEEHLVYPGHMVRKTISEVDIMAVRNKRTPLAVVNNFDLTFCQVWFDGSDVYASHPEHIKSKFGFIRYDYCKTLVNGNMFLKNRIRKYISRGFKILFDPNFSDVFLGDDFFKDVCSPKARILYCSPTDDLPSRNSWFNKIALRWVVNERDSDDNNNLIIPLKEHRYERFDQHYANPNMMPWGEYNNMRFFEIKISDGYDTDDIVDEYSLKTLALTHYRSENNEDPSPSDDLIFYRIMTKLAMNSLVETTDKSFANFIYKLRYRNTRVYRKAKEYVEFLINKSLREGSDIFGNDGKLYDIHLHDIDGGITRESLETYLSDTLPGSSYDVKCYYAGAGCKKKLTQSEIKTLVTPEFYQTYSAPRIIKTGLNNDVDNYELVFRNTKSIDAVYGNIYHATMCPYCLKFDERGGGCAIMTHGNPEGLGDELSPYCPNNKSVDSIRQKYLDAEAQLLGRYSHLEFCVECGRPCSAHQHFKLDLSGMVELNLIQEENGALVNDYGSCVGGGRVEMIARMLAVRDVYNNPDITDSVEERRIAAEAADAAPLNPELMARAQAIWDKAPADRKWNVEVPKKKRYNNILDKNTDKNNTDKNNDIVANDNVVVNNNGVFENNNSVNNEFAPIEPNHHGGAKNIVTLNELRKLRSLSRKTRRSRR